MIVLADYAMTLLLMLGAGVRQRLRRGSDPGDAGLSTLEMTILALGLMAVAGILAAAITAAVTRRTSQIQ